MKRMYNFFLDKVFKILISYSNKTLKFISNKILNYL